MELFEDTINILILIGFLYIIWLWINTPIYIAKHRGITDGELTTIKILSWCGLLLLITWFIALILSLIKKKKKWITDKNLEKPTTDISRLEALEKLHNLYNSNVLTKQEYEKKKKELLNN